MNVIIVVPWGLLVVVVGMVLPDAILMDNMPGAINMDFNKQVRMEDREEDNVFHLVREIIGTVVWELNHCIKALKMSIMVVVPIIFGSRPETDDGVLLLMDHPECVNRTLPQEWMMVLGGFMPNNLMNTVKIRWAVVRPPDDDKDPNSTDLDVVHGPRIGVPIGIPMSLSWEAIAVDMIDPSIVNKTKIY